MKHSNKRSLYDTSACVGAKRRCIGTFPTAKDVDVDDRPSSNLLSHAKVVFPHFLYSIQAGDVAGADAAAMRLVEMVSDDGGRFLSFVRGRWYVVGRAIAFCKASQVLREAALA